MTEVTRDGFGWVNREGTDDYLAYLDHEPEVTRLLGNYHGNAFIDIGAHVGRYTVRCARNFRTVWAWEPGVSQREGLAQNLHLNRLNNVVVVPFAAWSHPSTLNFGTPEKNAQATVVQGQNECQVEARRVDEVVHDWVDLIKIDVEGAEVQVLEGLTSILMTCAPLLYVEIHDWLDPELGSKCRQVLEPYGYKIREFDVHGETYWECR